MTPLALDAPRRAAAHARCPRLRGVRSQPARRSDAGAQGNVMARRPLKRLGAVAVAPRGGRTHGGETLNAGLRKGPANQPSK